MRKGQIDKLSLTVVETYFRKYVTQQSLNLFVSVAEVKVSPDLSMFNIYLDLIAPPTLDERAVLHTISVEHGQEIKKYIATHLRHRIRRVPATVQFYLHKDPFGQPTHFWEEDLDGKHKT